MPFSSRKIVPIYSPNLWYQDDHYYLIFFSNLIGENYTVVFVCMSLVLLRLAETEHSPLSTSYSFPFVSCLLMAFVFYVGSLRMKDINLQHFVCHKWWKYFPSLLLTFRFCSCT